MRQPEYQPTNRPDAALPTPAQQSYHCTHCREPATVRIDAILLCNGCLLAAMLSPSEDLVWERAHFLPVVPKTASPPTT